LLAPPVKPSRRRLTGSRGRVGHIEDIKPSSHAPTRLARRRRAGLPGLDAKAPSGAVGALFQSNPIRKEAVDIMEVT
jgi:hypothetical protein